MKKHQTVKIPPADDSLQKSANQELALGEWMGLVQQIEKSSLIINVWCTKPNKEILQFRVWHLFTNQRTFLCNNRLNDAVHKMMSTLVHLSLLSNSTSCQRYSRWQIITQLNSEFNLSSLIYTCCCQWEQRKHNKTQSKSKYEIKHVISYI